MLLVLLWMKKTIVLPPSSHEADVLRPVCSNQEPYRRKSTDGPQAPNNGIIIHLYQWTIKAQTSPNAVKSAKQKRQCLQLFAMYTVWENRPIRWKEYDEQWQSNGMFWLEINYLVCHLITQVGQYGSSSRPRNCFQMNVGPLVCIQFSVFMTPIYIYIYNTISIIYLSIHLSIYLRLRIGQPLKNTFQEMKKHSGANECLMY